MQNNTNAFENSEDSLNQNLQMRKIFYRILPFWPLILLAILLGYMGAKIYLRYATKIYTVKARVIVNDDSQQKTANLVDIVQLDTRNMSIETEKEMEILRSRNLLARLATKLQLNINYGLKGYVTSGLNEKDVPFKLEIQNPDSVFTPFSGSVQLLNNKIKFNNTIYPCDTFIQTEYGKINWHIYPKKIDKKVENQWFVTVETIDNTVNQLQQALTINPISNQSSILAISYNDVLPERGVKILNNLFSLYGSTTVDYKSRISQNTLHFLDERLALVSNDLNDVEKELQDYKTNNDIVDLSTQGSVVLDQLKGTDTKISELNVQKDVLNKIKSYVINRNNTDSQIPASLGIQDPVLNALLNQLYQQEFELQKTTQTSGIKNPRIPVLEENISKLQSSILVSINNLQTGITASLEQLESDNNKLTSSLNKMPVKERQLLDISRQQGIKNGIYTFLLQKREEAAISSAAVVANYRVIDKPEIEGLVWPKSSLVYGIGIMLAVILLISFIYLKEFASTRLKFKSEISSRTNVPVLAEIAYQPDTSKSSVVVEEGKRSRIAEEFRELRTNLNYLTFKSTAKSKVILITSSIPNEGKSFISINTSISISLTGSKVVLLELDLRKPKISSEFGIPKNPGLSTYLIDKADLNQIVKPHPTIVNFSIIPSGPIPPNPSELINGQRLKDLITNLKEKFDFIIIDSPPVRAVTDAKILASICDVTLYIMRQNYTDISFLDFINELEEKKMFPGLNIIFNGIKLKSIPGYGYAYTTYGYNYGYGYGYTDKDDKKEWWKFLKNKK